MHLLKQKGEVSQLSLPAETTSVVDTARDVVIADVRTTLGDAIFDALVQPDDDIWIRVSTHSWNTCMQKLSAMGYAYFCFLSAIDWMPSPFGRGKDGPAEPAPERDTTIRPGYTVGDTRMQMLVRLVNSGPHMGINIKTDVPNDGYTVDSIANVFAGANWYERGAHEMFGIGFTGHPDLRNMYLPTDFKDFPIRKDFPLLARMVKPWPGIVDVEPLPGGDAGLKYFVLGGFASAFFLYGVELVFGTTGSTNITAIAGNLSQEAMFGGSSAMLLAGIAMLLVGIGFKVSLVPFQTWTADVYQGAPTPITALMGSVGKTAAFVALSRVFVEALPGRSDDWRPAVLVLAIVTLIVGSVVADVQTDVKRMLAYSAVTHGGFILVGLEASGTPLHQLLG